MCGITAVLTLAGRSTSSQLEKNAHRENRDPNAPIVNGLSKVQNGKPQDLRQKVNESLKLITHRGPDFSGSWASDDGLIGIFREQ